MLGVAGLACHPDTAPDRPASEAAAASRGWHYRVRLEDTAAAAHVTLCFEGKPTGRLIPSEPEALDLIVDAHIVDASRSGRRLSGARGGGLALDDVAAQDCIAYDIDFFEAARSKSMSRKIRWEGESVLLRPSMWLWHPSRVPSGTEITLTFELPEGVAASVPWPLLDGRRDGRNPTYGLDPTAFRWLGYNVFGKPHIQRFRAAGTRIELTVLDAERAATGEGLRRWATDAAHSVALLYGTYPRDHLQIVVVPVDGRGSTIYFGAAGRGGGAGVYISMDASARDEDLPGGWTTVHELLHHGMPFVEDPWMGEGWVSYYTEIMRTRMGHRSEQEGWQELHEAFGRGRRGGRGMSLRRISEAMHEAFAYQRVYWGGAAIAFFIDVALREDSGGKLSLDDAMRELRRCCGEARHKWEAEALLEKLDTWYGKPLFTEIALGHLDGASFPPVDEVFARLGVRIEDNRVVLDESHPNAAMRRAIMAPRRFP